MTSTFWPTAEQFLRATLGRKNVCRSPKCDGVLFSVEQPRIRHAMNQQTYQCDKCGATHIVQGEAP